MIVRQDIRQYHIDIRNSGGPSLHEHKQQTPHILEISFFFKSLSGYFSVLYRPYKQVSKNILQLFKLFAAITYIKPK